MRIIRICFAKVEIELKKYKRILHTICCCFFWIIYKGGAYKAYTLMIFSEIMFS